MKTVSEQELRNSLLSTRMDRALRAAAGNDRTNSMESLCRQVGRLPTAKKGNVLGALIAAHFPFRDVVAAAFATKAPEQALDAAAKVLFLVRNERSLLATARAFRLYGSSRFFGQICAMLGEAAEISGPRLYRVAGIWNAPEFYGFIRLLEFNDSSARILAATGRVAIYTKNRGCAVLAARFLFARRHSSYLQTYCWLVESAIFFVREPASARDLFAGLTAGHVDVVIQKRKGIRSELSPMIDSAIKAKGRTAVIAILRQMLRNTGESKPQASDYGEAAVPIKRHSPAVDSSAGSHGRWASA